MCRWAGGLAWTAPSSRCENIAPMAFERPRASVPLPSPPLVVDCALLGRSSSRAILASSTRAGCYPCGILAQETCQDECGVATGREEPLTSGGTGHHNLLIPYPSHSPTICSETLPRHGQSVPSTLSFFGGNRRRVRNLPWGKGLRDEKEFSAISVGGGAKKVAPARHNCN